MNFGLYLLSHYDLRARPDRTERALRVFFPKQAAEYLAALGRGEEVLVRHGNLDMMNTFAGNLSAQGFNPVVRALD